LFVTAALVAFVVGLATLVRPQLYAAEVVHFVVPGTLVAAFLLWTEWRVAAGSSPARFMALGRRLAPFLFGVALPILVFLVPYARAGALDAFGYGVFVLPTKRFQFAAYRALPLWTMVALLPVLLLVAGGRALRGQSRRWPLLLFVAILAALFAVSLRTGVGYRFVWYSAKNLPPLIVLAGVAVLARGGATDAEGSPDRARLVLLLGATALCSLVQFPYAAGNYFCYVAPLIVVTAVALLRALPPPPPAVPAALVAFYGAFAVVRMNGSPLYLMGERYIAPAAMQPLALTRGGIDVPDYQAPVYRGLITALRQHARGGYTWASPDCPEMYFLSGLRNPTRSVFDFFDEPRGRTERVLAALDARGVTAVVLNRLPAFSPELTPDLIAPLEQRYPYAADFGPFQLRWRP
jgi:hypothetical protein